MQQVFFAYLFLSIINLHLQAAEVPSFGSIKKIHLHLIERLSGFEGKTTTVPAIKWYGNTTFALEGVAPRWLSSTESGPPEWETLVEKVETFRNKPVELKLEQRTQDIATPISQSRYFYTQEKSKSWSYVQPRNEKKYNETEPFLRLNNPKYNNLVLKFNLHARPPEILIVDWKQEKIVAALTRTLTLNKPSWHSSQLSINGSWSPDGKKIAICEFIKGDHTIDKKRYYTNSLLIYVADVASLVKKYGIEKSMIDQPES